MRGKIRVPKMTHERVREVLDYNPATGVFVWKVSPARNIAVGSVAGGSKKSGFRYIVVDGEGVTAPRLAWFYTYGKWPERRVGFKNRDTNDCRLENLAMFDGLGEEYDPNNSEGLSYHQVLRRKFPPRRSEKELKRVFGIGLKEYDEMLEAQANRCAICKQPETHMRNGRFKALAVDHDHVSGRVRGLLCSDCNTGLGKMKDDPRVLFSAYQYLMKNFSAASFAVEETPGTLALSTGPAGSAQTIGQTLAQEERV